jgi:tripartite-type tricarboxylate transporter receptor subunit TctC
MTGPGRRSLGLAALGLLARPAQAGGLTGAVSLLVPGPAGGNADGWARGIAPFLERHLPGAQIAVVNRPGESGLAAARSLATAAPDGHVLGAVATPLLLARAIAAGEAALLDRLDFLGAIAEEPVLLVGHPALAPDLAALQAQGEQALLGTPPAGGAAQLAGLAFARAWPLTLLAFANAQAARQAVIAGNVAAAMLALPEALAALRDDRLVGLGLAAAGRCPLLPELPTLREQGIPVQVAAYRGFALPAGTPAAPRDALASALQAVVTDSEFLAAAESEGYLPRYLPAARWEALVRAKLRDLTAQWRASPWLPRQD